MKLTPASKGLMTAILMIIGVLVTFYSGMAADSPFQYLIYAFYALGIVWTLVAYSKSENYTGKFGDTFNQGFRCFIIVTLLMVAFTFIFNKIHPEFVTESAQLYKEALLKDKDHLPADIETDVARYKNGYLTTLIYGSIFGYLIIGAGVTAVVSALITRRK